MVDITINSFFIKNEGCVIVVDEITKRVSLVELFYDLVFVYMVSRATEMIHHLHHGIVGLPVLGIFAIVVTDLTPKEFDLLYTMAQKPKQVFSRDQLLELVWGYEYYGEERTVDAHIKKLRQKLEI